MGAHTVQFYEGDTFLIKGLSDYAGSANQRHARARSRRPAAQSGRARLQGHVRDSDTVARLGGDEFTITLADLHDIVSVTDIAQKLCDDLARPFMVGDELASINSPSATFFPATQYNRRAQPRANVLQATLPP